MISAEWNGTVYDLDLTGYPAGELHELEQRTGVSWRHTIVGLLNLSPDSVRAPFWLTDRRDSTDLKWSEYAGPPPSVVMPYIAAVREVVTELGKRIFAAVPATSGSDDSPSDVDSLPPSSTL